MLEIKIPGRPQPLQIQAVALDYNGTIARDGALLEAAIPCIRQLGELVPVYVLTADTYGTVQEQCRDLPVCVKTFPRENAAPYKEEIVRSLGKDVAAVGNGFNDIPMFDASALAIAVIEKEGVCAALLSHADVAVTSPEDALLLLLKPDRLRATLRS